MFINNKTLIKLIRLIKIKSVNNKTFNFIEYVI